MDDSVWSEKLLDATIRADRAGAAAIVERALAEGMSPPEVLTSVLDPALVRIGEMWEQETASLAQTFIAAKVAEDTLLHCAPEDGATAASSKGHVVIGNIEDDFHGVGRRIVGTFLRAADWDVVDLGNDVLAEELVAKAIEIDARVVGVSAMMYTTAMNIHKLRNLIDERGLAPRLKLAVGGAVFGWRPDLVEEVGGGWHGAECCRCRCAVQSAASGSIGGIVVNAYERLMRTLQGESTDRVPVLAVLGAYGGKLTGVDMQTLPSIHRRKTCWP